jgi:hypothetical protein
LVEIKIQWPDSIDEVSSIRPDWRREGAESRIAAQASRKRKSDTVWGFGWGRAFKAALFSKIRLFRPFKTIGEVDCIKIMRFS